MSKLLDMEKLHIHLNPVQPSGSADSPTPNLSVVFCGEPKIFLTHDNGGRPFKVAVTRDYVSVHAAYDPGDEGGKYQEGKAPLIAEFSSCEKVFVGVSSGSSWCDHPVDWKERFGNSILVCLAGGRSEVAVGSNPPNVRMNYRTDQLEPVEKFRFHRLFEAGSAEAAPYCSKLPGSSESGQVTWPGRSYVFIGDSIYIFTPPEDDEILEFYSMIGGSDVPYPVAVGRKYLYFMNDMKCVLRSAIKEEEWLQDPAMVDKDSDGPRWEDAYNWFYGSVTKEMQRSFPQFIQLGDRQ